MVGTIALAAVSSFGQGVIRLDNYDSYGPYVTYGIGWGALTGTGLGSSWTMGFYYWNALGDYTASTVADPGGFALPTTLGNYVLATGPGSTATFGYGGQNGAAYSGSAWTVPIVPGPTGGATITLMIVAYEGSSDATAFQRGHSAPFTLVTSDATSPSPIETGTAMPASSVNNFPEPSTLALAGLGACLWMAWGRRGNF